MKWPFAGLLLHLLWVGFFQPCVFAADAPRLRNIVLVVADDQSPDFGAYGNKVMKTPNLDALAAAGTRFNHAFATTASCSASRSVILTGLHNHANGQYGHQHDFHKFGSYDNVVSLPVYLAAGGYRTIRCGKFHVAPEQVYQFDKEVPANPRNMLQMAENCKAVIEEKSDKPFFLYFCTSDPHRGGGFANELPGKPDRFGNPAPGAKAKPGKAAPEHEVIYDPKDVIVPAFLPDTETSRAELAQYYQSCSRIDRGLGRLVEILKTAGQWDNTLVIYIADHGMAFPGAKTTVYEAGLRAPLLVRNPFIEKRGVVSEAMISWIDLTPTILDFAGLLEAKTNTVKADVLAKVSPVKVTDQKSRDLKRGQFHGRSFLSILDQDKPAGWDDIGASHTFHEIQMYYPMRVVRDRQYKLIWNIAHPLPFPFATDLWEAPTWQAQYKLGPDAPYGGRTVGSYIKRPQFELYDIEKDPNETKNLAADTQYQRVLEQMKAKLKAFQKRTDDPWIMKWEYE